MAKRTSKPPAPSMAEATALKFFERFAGLTRAHGSYALEGNATPGIKHVGKAITRHEGPTPELWQRHLAGEYGIGIVPIRDDSTVRFGAIDVDKYDTKLPVLEQRINELGLPLVICRSKSGGAHIFCFTKNDCPAGVMRGRLQEWATVIGHPGAEIFPKQVRLASERDVGNWINMPYFAGDKTTRAAIFKGKPLTVQAFLLHADQRAVTSDQLVNWTLPQEGASSDFQEGPPCLIALAAQGYPPGTRNSGLFNIAVFLRKRFGDQWEERISEYNSTYMTPPLPQEEVRQVSKHARKKEYEYRCQEPPIAQVCNRALCVTRKYGIGQANIDPGVSFGTLVKVLTDPPTWIWDVDGVRMELETADLTNQKRFNLKAMELLNKWPELMKAKQWVDLVRERLTNLEVQEAPPEATNSGLVQSMLASYFTTRAISDERNDLLLQRPWKSDDRVYFSAADFRRYCEQQRIHIDQRQLWLLLRTTGADHHFFRIKGRGVNCWSVPAPELQAEAHSTPELEPDKI